MKLLLIQVYLQIIVVLQYSLLAISRWALFLYGPLPDVALRMRMIINDYKRERDCTK